MKVVRYIEEINGIRAVACLSVLAVHVSAGVYHQQGGWDGFTTLINQLARFGTPVFAVISGFLLFHQVQVKGFRLWGFIRSRTHKIVIPYLLWSMVYLTILKVGYQVDHFISWKHWLMTMASGRAFYHLYFVVAVIQFYLLFPLLQRMLRSTFSWWAGVTVALALNLAFLTVDPSVWAGEWGKIFLPVRKALLPAWIFCFLLGGLLSHHWDRLREWLCVKGSWFSALAIPVLIGGVVEYQMMGLYGPARPMNLLNTPILVLAGLVGFLQWRNRWPGVKRGLMALGNLSFGIYLVHPVIIMLMMETIPPRVWSPTLLPLLYGVALVLTVGLIQWIRCLPFHHYLLTVPRRNTPTGTAPESGRAFEEDSASA